ncbi:hypothetical protein [Cecembia rubra]|uniref:Outer membrane protein with beta-barrel domain n=1 Tax=Cecembia rubra TaxID=1485585 RepID=A0A2P8E7U5_9BACT|nr:hypothetical protein [Cecembia rubra]PSL05544.1 hypothetical protein CLV48_10354 [Cecembia rubra]
MRIRFRFLLIVVFSVLFCIQVQAQSKIVPVHAGVYYSGLKGQVAIGTDIEQKYFGELRFGANDMLDSPFGIEALFHRNLVREEWFNFHMGFMVGAYFESDDFRVGIPLGFTIKPFENHRQLAFLMEATPNVFVESYFNLRANLGLRYTFR